MHVVVETVNCISVSCTRRTTSNGARYSTVLKNMYVKASTHNLTVTTFSASLYFWFQICFQKALHDLQGEKKQKKHRRLLGMCQNMVWIHMHWVLWWHQIQNKDHKSKCIPQHTKHAASCFSQIRLRQATQKLWKLFFGFLFFHLEKKRIRSIKMIVFFQNGWNLLAVDRLM